MKTTLEHAGVEVSEAGVLMVNIIFGLVKRNGRAYPGIVSDCSKATLQGFIRGRIELERIIHSVG